MLVSMLVCMSAHTLLTKQLKIFQPNLVGSYDLAIPTSPFIFIFKVIKVKGQGYRVKKVKFQLL